MHTIGFFRKLIHQTDTRRPQYGENGRNLIDFVFAGEQRVLSVELEEDAADAPDVHFFRVVAVSEQTLRRAVPAGRDILGVRGGRMDVWLKAVVLLQEPKSAILISRSPETSMFSGLISRWNSPFSCTKSMASRMSWPTDLILSKLNSAFLFLYSS